MEKWADFINELKKNISNQENQNQYREILKIINEYFYVENSKLGTTNPLDEEIDYFSPFNKFWEENCEKILDIQISENIVNKIAKKLLSIIDDNNELLPIKGGEKSPPKDMASEDIAKVRFFSANQDYKIDIKNPYKIYTENPSYFDKKELIDNKDKQNALIRSLGAKSQYDKRMDYVQNAAKFLEERNISAYKIAECFNQDAEKIRKEMIQTENMGYSEKKTDMFIRDMVELDVWPKLKNLQSIDVASDKNTMKIALRTGLIKSAIPALSSFLDIFCYQYSIFDEKTAEAWRKVWEKMRELNKEKTPLYPGGLDYFLYNLGRKVCKFNITTFVCNSCNNEFKWNNSRKRSCPICDGNDITIKSKKLPCQVGGFSESNIEAVTDIIPLYENNCIFSEICKESNKILNPPNSISIKGRTGWDSARTNKGGGGGLTS